MSKKTQVKKFTNKTMAILFAERFVFGIFASVLASFIYDILN